ncbi:MAG: hypothetical protein HC845_07300 [Akkermansiaceae bacterium]|nr:hypothetical protein [Akkermansiaceae bacterium]
MGGCENDGERWRFALAERSRLSQNSAPEIYQLAQFSQSQFGEGTLSSYGWRRNREPEAAKGILQLDTLAEDECLAKTSDGIRRFRLPAGHHFIALYRSLLDDKSYGPLAGDALVEVFLGRDQRDKAREVLEKTIAKYGDGTDDARKKLLKQIIGNWGRFGAAETVPAGQRPSLPLAFRNATNIKLTATLVNMDAVLRDVITYLESNPKEIDSSKISPQEIAQRLIDRQAQKYIRDPAATWQVKLSPNDKHRDTETNVELPLNQAGAWWISAEIEGGNSFKTLAWIVDSVLLQKDVNGRMQWWVADAKMGAPIAGAQVELFGYRSVEIENPLPKNAATMSFPNASPAPPMPMEKYR